MRTVSVIYQYSFTNLNTFNRKTLRNVLHLNSVKDKSGGLLDKKICNTKVSRSFIRIIFSFHCEIISTAS